MENEDVIRGHRMTNAEYWALAFPEQPYIGDEDFEKLLDKILAPYTIKEDIGEKR